MPNKNKFLGVTAVIGLVVLGTVVSGGSSEALKSNVDTVVSSVSSSTSTEVLKNEDSTTLLPPCAFSSPDRKYNLDTACDRQAHNAARAKINRGSNHKRLLSTGVSRVPDQRTVHCPTSTITSLASPNDLVGLDTVWVLENTASTPVVVAWVRDGIEYSVMDARVTPAHHDPNAVLRPGRWKSYLAHEGHVFHVRALAEDDSVGPLLLRHRAGMIPVRNRYGPRPLRCDATHDPEPVVVAPVEPHEPPPAAPEFVLDPAFERTPTEYGRACNAIDVGFRNAAGCPLHGHYTRTQRLELDTMDTTTSTTTTKHPPTCDETFKFHLGLNPRTDDFMHDWESDTKFEGTFYGHNFVFRLASDPDIVVDQYTVEPTYVRDCPRPSTSGAGAAMVLMAAKAMRQLKTTNYNATDYDYEDYNATNYTEQVIAPPVFNFGASVKKDDFYLASSTMISF